MPGFLQRIIRSGTRPVPLAPRPGWQAPVLGLELTDMIEPKPSPQPQRSDAQLGPTPLHPHSSNRADTDSVQAAPDRVEMQSAEARSKRPVPIQTTASPVSGALPSSPAEPPSQTVFPQGNAEDFVVPRRHASTPVAGGRRVLPAEPISPNTGSPSPLAINFISENETVFRVPSPKPPQSTHREPVGAAETRAANEKPPVAIIAQQFQDVISWIESGQLADPEPVPPRPEVRDHIVPHHDATVGAERAAETIIVQDPSAPAPSSEPRPARPVQSSRMEREPPAGAATAALTVRELDYGHRTGPPAAAKRAETGPRLTVNHLNVQLINEDRRASKEPARAETARASVPRADWARYERRHMRVP
jgi:hypothetical protein